MAARIQNSKARPKTDGNKVVTVQNEPEVKEIMNKITKLSAKHGRWEVFADWVECSAIAISNSVDGMHYNQREETYKKIMSKYEIEERQIISSMFDLLVTVMERLQDERHYEDIMGYIYHEMGLNNENTGQFFTPGSICKMLGNIAIDEKAMKLIAQKGYISISEPACGAGATILGGIEAVVKMGGTPAQVSVKATDIDIKCVQMAYVQLSLYGVPAVVTHGNTLSMEEWQNWYTPAYIADGWYWRDAEAAGKVRQEIEVFRRASNPLYATMKDSWTKVG